MPKFWIKPGLLIVPIQDHGHAIMDVAHEFIGGCRQNGERPALVGPAGMPSLPDPGDAHDQFIVERNSERVFSVIGCLPFEEPADYAGRGAMPNRRATIPKSPVI